MGEAVKDKRTYSVRLNEGEILIGVQSWEADTIVVEGGLERITGTFPTRDWQTVVVGDSGKNYLPHQILGYGRFIPNAP